MAALWLSFIPLIGLLFSFTNTIGAAMWAADLEARSNLIDIKIQKPSEEDGKNK